MRALIAAAAGLVLTACGESSPRSDEARSNGGGELGFGETSVRPPASAPPNPLGGGQRMAGAVSGLTGKVTAFRVEETATQIIVELAADVLFAFDQASLSPQAPEQLHRTVAQIGRGGSGDIEVTGHTDSMGTDAYNDALSLRRAEAVVAWLASEGGVDRGRLKADGRGVREPEVPNATPAGADIPENRARNRRVTVVIPKA